MTRRFRLLPPAKADLDDQALYFGSRKRDLGRRYLLAARRTFAQIARQPGIHARYGFKNSRLTEIRVCQVEGVPNLLVFYRIAADATEILRVIHGARDIDSLEDEMLPE